jgi:diaminohydroxyphosphoribosylaminopyrimidine deaminase/5-amino-6-(5-phosphoribosylamino)uracil reductase
MDHAGWMGRCLELARLGAGHAAPNPLVGAVLVQGGRALSEGWHRGHGGPHAEVECLRAFGEGPVPADAVMYVSLEPCAHTGLTPPCADLLLARGVRTVVAAATDPDPRVSGQGFAKLRAHGTEVVEGVLGKEARWLNRRFFHSTEKGRPWVVLKWARSTDGYMDRHPRTGRGVQRISQAWTDMLVHRWRSEEQAILVGGRTVLNDDPRLDVRHVAGRSPLRVVLDRSVITPASSKVYADGRPTLLFTAVPRSLPGVEEVGISKEDDPITTVLAELHRRKIRSVLVEGGAELLGHFIAAGAWDEAREIIGAPVFRSGTKAPDFPTRPCRSMISGADRILLGTRETGPDVAWPW